MPATKAWPLCFAAVAGPADPVFREALAVVPAGRWIVGVSGGADSVALIRGLRAYRPELSILIAHLNHESRGEASDADAEFVRSLAASLGVEAKTERLSDVADTPKRGHEAVYRQARLTLFRRLATERAADGVLLAHHAHDRAETVLLRLLRGGEPWALAGLRREATVAGLRIYRPLIDVRPATLRAYLADRGHAWREDESNRSMAFARNRVRSFLATRPDLVPSLLAMAGAADRLRAWTIPSAPALPAEFQVDVLADLPDPLARASGRRWLRQRGVLQVAATDAERLVRLCRDRVTPALCTFASGVRVRRGRRTVGLAGG